MNINDRIKELDRNCCRVIGCQSSFLQIHHIIPKGFTESTNTPDNLISLCVGHHIMITEGKLTSLAVLKTMLEFSDFRWHKAYEWHLSRQIIKNVKRKLLLGEN